MKEANQKNACDFYTVADNEPWHIFETWITHFGQVCWYTGRTMRETRYGPVTFYRTFAPEEIDVPVIAAA